ncbi:hypothetical protein OQA88_12098 [Cercophora sp. LCS_1]
MSSSPDTVPPSENEPLLGGPGDAIQKPNEPLVRNLWLGTGWLSLLGLALLLLQVLSAVSTHPVLRLVTPHPVLQTVGLTTLVLAILILQPTSTAPAKLAGQRAHAILMAITLVTFVAGISVIETNKHVNHLPHLHSLHAYLGVIAGTFFLAQYVFGVLMWAVPGALGGEQKAKSLWKYHRWGGYGFLVLILVTVVSAADTDYAKKVLGVKVWGVALAAGLVVTGVFPRIQVRKLGIQRG